MRPPFIYVHVTKDAPDVVCGICGERLAVKAPAVLDTATNLVAGKCCHGELVNAHNALEAKMACHGLRHPEPNQFTQEEDR